MTGGVGGLGGAGGWAGWQWRAGEQGTEETDSDGCRSPYSPPPLLVIPSFSSSLSPNPLSSNLLLFRSLTAPETDVRNRRESHRAIERRRRDHINSGIEELSKLVPGVPRSKGKTVHRAAAYIRHVAECEERFNQQGPACARNIRVRVE